MALKAIIEHVQCITHDVWEARLTENEVRQLGGPYRKLGKITVIGALGAVFDQRSSTLVVEPGRVCVFNQGESEKVLIVNLGSASASQKNLVVDETTRDEENRQIGDASFVKRCEVELGDEKAGWMNELLQRVREEFPGELHEHKARKWVNHPDNFFAIVIQPRNKALCFHVRGTPDVFQPGSLRIVDDRPSYSRFWVERENQLSDAIRVVMEAGRKRPRRT